MYFSFHIGSIYLRGVSVTYFRGSILENTGFLLFICLWDRFPFEYYGVNGIRNGMATSVFILAFGFYHQNPLLCADVAGLRIS